MSWSYYCFRAEIMTNHPNTPNTESADPESPDADLSVSDEKLYLFDKPKNVQRLMRGFYASCVLLVLAEFVIHRHVVHPWEGLFGFHALYGFVACVVLVIIATEMRKLLMRDEDYYDNDGNSDDSKDSTTLNSDHKGGHDNVGC